MRTPRTCHLLFLACLLVLALLLIPLSATADTAVNTTVAYTAKNGLQYAATASGLWLNEGGQLKWFQESAFEPVLVQKEDNVPLISTQGDDLVYLTEDAEGQKISILMIGGTYLVHNVPIQSKSPIVQMDCYYALDAQGRISSIYTFEGTLTALSVDGWANEGVSTFAFWDNFLLTYKAATGELALLNLNTRKTVCPPVYVPSLACVQVGAAAGERAIAIGLDDAGQLLRINLMDGSSEVLDAGLPGDCAGLSRNSKYFYTLGKNGTTLYALPTRQLLGQMSDKTLTFVNGLCNDDRFEAAVDKFHEKYPDVNVESRSIDDSRVIATEIMGGREGIDIIGIQENNMSISAGMLLKSGALLDLNQFEELTALKEEYRDIFGAGTIEGHWFAFPGDYWLFPWRVNEKLANQIGWEIPTGRWTWDDFLALAEKVKAWNETEDSHIYLLQDEIPILPYFFREFQANHVNVYTGEAEYQSEEYIRLLNMWKNLNDDGLLYSSPFRLNPSMGRNTLLYTYYTHLTGMKRDRYIYPPTETLESLIPTYLVPAIALNANTPYLEEAVHFLACYISPEVVAKDIYWNIGQQLKDRSWYNTEMWDWGPTVSEENETLWNEMITQGAPELALLDIERQQWQTLLPGLLDGTVSAEQFAAISQQLADMALGE